MRILASPFQAMPWSFLPSAQSSNLPTSRLPLPADPAPQPQLTQSAAVELLLRQLPLQVGAEELERVVVRGLLQLARKMGQSRKVQGWERGPGAGHSLCPTAKRIK